MADQAAAGESGWEEERIVSTGVRLEAVLNIEDEDENEEEDEKALRSRRLLVAVGDARLAQVVGRYLDSDFVPDADADEVFAHLARDVRQHFVTVGQSHAEHGARQHLRHGASQFDWFFFCHSIGN